MAKLASSPSSKRLICFCNNVPYERVQEAIEQGAHDVSAIYDACGAGTGPCGGSCRHRILELIRQSDPQPTAPQVDPIPDALIEAVSLFNRRYYWETHEVLEEIWMEETGPRKLFYQGLIQAAATLYHVLNANPKGVIKLAPEAVQKLQKYVPQYLSIPLDGLCASLQSYAQEARDILGRTRAGFDYDALPYLLLGSEMEAPHLPPAIPTQPPSDGE